MTRLLTALSLFISALTFSQDFKYPSIAPEAQNLKNFIPAGWVLLDSTQGDLNNDHHNDLAIVLQHKDSVSLIKKVFSFNDTLITQPRILLIAFYNPVKKNYILKEQSNSFILNFDNPNMEDPYGDISIYNGILQIDFIIFMHMGSWGMLNNTYKFRFQQNNFALIGAESNTAQRNTGETENRSYNFLTKKVKIVTGNFSSDVKNETWRNIEIPELKTLKTLFEPFTWEVEKDFYL